MPSKDDYRRVYLIVLFILLTLSGACICDEKTVEIPSVPGSTVSLSDVQTIPRDNDTLFYLYVGPITSSEATARRVRLPRLLYRIKGKLLNNNATTDALGSKISDVPLLYNNFTPSATGETITVRRDIILDYDTERYFFVIQRTNDRIVGNDTHFMYVPDSSLDKEIARRKRKSNAIIISIIVGFAIFCLIILSLLLFCAIKVIRGMITPNFMDKLKEIARKQDELPHFVNSSPLIDHESLHNEVVGVDYDDK